MTFSQAAVKLGSCRHLSSRFSCHCFSPLTRASSLFLFSAQRRIRSDPEHAERSRVLGNVLEYSYREKYSIWKGHISTRPAAIEREESPKRCLGGCGTQAASRGIPTFSFFIVLYINRRHSLHTLTLVHCINRQSLVILWPRCTSI